MIPLYFKNFIDKLKGFLLIYLIFLKKGNDRLRSTIFKRDSAVNNLQRTEFLSPGYQKTR